VRQRSVGYEAHLFPFGAGESATQLAALLCRRCGSISDAGRFPPTRGNRDLSLTIGFVTPAGASRASAMATRDRPDRARPDAAADDRNRPGAGVPSGPSGTLATDDEEERRCRSRSLLLRRQAVVSNRAHETPAADGEPSRRDRRPRRPGSAEHRAASRMSGASTLGLERPPLACAMREQQSRQVAPGALQREVRCLRSARSAGERPGNGIEQRAQQLASVRVRRYVRPIVDLSALPRKDARACPAPSKSPGSRCVYRSSVIEPRAVVAVLAWPISVARTFRSSPAALR